MSLAGDGYKLAGMICFKKIQTANCYEGQNYDDGDQRSIDFFDVADIGGFDLD